ncbi:MAG: CHC2 zinc finger domain-containing protein, partial [Pseudomonadota bacterium]|nr:CHC2 zinc finger domain-containing protein [Pseudomonadota bacterium]
MKNIDRAFIDDLLSRIDIVEVINDKVKLKQQGNS